MKDGHASPAKTQKERTTLNLSAPTFRKHSGARNKSDRSVLKSFTASPTLRAMTRALVVLASISLWACTPPPAPQVTTWHKDVAPIIQRKCATCHEAGNIAPFSLQTLADWK